MNASIRGVDKQGIDRRMMFHMVVHTMDTSKELYVNTLSFKVIKDVGRGDMHQVSLERTSGGTSLHLTTVDMQAAYKQLGEKGASQIADDLYDPSSGAI